VRGELNAVPLGADGDNNERISAVLAVLTRLTGYKVVPAKTHMIVRICADDEHTKPFGLDQQRPTPEP